MIFCNANYAQAEALKDILHKYELASRQTINFAKTNVVYSKGVSAECRNQITLCLDIREVLLRDKYLGAPTLVSQSRKKPSLFLIDRLENRLSGYMDRLASSVGREVLIKVVAQAIPTYIMSLFKLPKELCHTIQSLIVCFWWGHKQEDHKIH